jgi:hypothetical protein
MLTRKEENFISPNICPPILSPIEYYWSNYVLPIYSSPQKTKMETTKVKKTSERGAQV